MVKQKFDKTEEGAIKSYVSRWFSGSGDREGGKMARLKAAFNKKTNETNNGN